MSQPDLFHTQKQLKIMRIIRGLGVGYCYRDPDDKKTYTVRDLTKFRNLIK